MNMLAGLLAGALCAAEYTFVGTNGVWSAAENWSPAGVPADGDVALFAASTTISNAVPLDGVVTIDVTNAATLSVSGRVYGEGGIVKTGYGSLVLTGNNSFTGNFTVSNGNAYARSPNALGDAAGGRVEIAANNRYTYLYFGGVHVRKNLVLRNCNDAGIGYSSFFRVEAHTTNRVSGTLSVPGHYLRMLANTGSRIDFAGGGTFGGNSAFLNRASGSEIRVVEKPISLVNRYNSDLRNGWLELDAAGCSFRDYSSSDQLCRGYRRLGCDGALDPSSVMNGGSGSLLNLNGTAQTIDTLFGRDPANPGRVYSDAPAALALTGTSLYTNTCVFTGPVDLALAGASTSPVTLTGASTSYGTLSIAAGKTVRLAPGASWRGGVVVRGALVLEDATALANAAFVDVWDGGSVTAPSGTLPAFRQTRRNGVAQDAPGITRTYQGTDGLWTNPDNWSPAGVPATGDTAAFTASATITENFDLPGGVTTIRETVSGATVTLAGAVGGTEASLVHNGSGTLVLAGTNTFTGAFTNRAGTVRVAGLTSIGRPGPLGAPRAAFAEIFNNGTLIVTETSATDRPYRGSYSAEWRVTRNKTLDCLGAVSGKTWCRDEGTLRLHAPSRITNFNRTDGGTVEMLCPTNAFTANPFFYAGTLVAASIANAGMPSAIGAGDALTFGQSNYTTPGKFVYAGWTNAVCDRRFFIYSSANSTFAQRDGLTFAVRRPGVSATYTGDILLAARAAANPFLLFDGAGDQTFTASIPAPFNLYKTGSGACTLAGANAATGRCTVASGRLDVDGSLAAGMHAGVSSGATLGGSGTIHASVSFAAGATLAAGASNRCGTLTFTTAPTCADGMRMALKLGTAAHDCVVLPGTPSLPAAQKLELRALRGERVPSGSYLLMRWTGKPATAFSAEGLAGRLAATSTGLVFTVTSNEDFLEATARTNAPLEIAAGAGTAYPTPAAARDAVRAMRLGGTVSPSLPIIISVAPGDYVLDAALELGSADSGNPGAPVVWRAAQRGTVRFLGARPLAAERFQPLAGDDPVRTRVNADAAESMRVADVADLLPATLPDWGLQSRMPAAPWFCRGGVFQDLARWPNRTSSASFGWAYAPRVTSAGASDKTGFTFTTPDDRAARWNFTEGVWLYGYWGNTWNETYVKAASWNAGTRELVLAGAPTYTASAGSHSGYPKYIALNLPEELDAPGEWWLDRTTRRLYYIPPDELETEEMALMASTSPLVTFATGAHDIRFENIGFAYAGRGFSTAGAVRRVAFDGCDFHSFLYASGLTGTDNAVRRCTFRHLGQGGVSLSGGTRKTLTRARNVVEDCEFTDFEVFEQTYCPAVSLNGVGNALRHCHLSESAHEAVGYGGNEHLIGWNEFDHVLRESADCGAIYTGRNTSTLGTQIVRNLFHDLDTGDITGIYFDDCDWGDDAIANAFTNVYRAFLVGGGNLHRLQWNTMKNGTYGIHVDRRGVAWQGRSEWLTGDNWCWQSFTDANPSNYPWTAAYPGLVETLNDNPRDPWHNALVGNLIEDYTYWTDIKATTSGMSYTASTNRMEIADNVTASTKGKSGVALLGFTHLSRAATPADVPGLPAALARLERLDHPDVVTVAAPDGNLRVRVGLDATARLCCRATYGGEDVLNLSPMGVTVDAIDYGRMQLPCAAAATTRTVANEKAVPSATTSGYVETSLPLEDAVRGGTNAYLDVRAYADGFAWRMRVPGSGTRTVAGEVAQWAACENGGFTSTAIPTNAWTCTGTVETDWHIARLATADISNGVLIINVPAGETRMPTIAERGVLVTNGVVGVVKTGTGTLSLSSALTGYEGWWAVSNGTVDVATAYDAFGSEGDAPVTVIENASEGVYPLVLSSSSVLTRPIALKAANSRSLEIRTGVQATFAKKVTVTGKNFRFDLESGSRATFSGGMVDSSSLVCLGGSGMFVFDKTPANISNLYAQHSVTTEFNCPSNRVDSITCAFATAGCIRLGCVDALAGNVSMRVADTTNYTLDLNGFDWRTGSWSGFSSGTLTSARPATLRFAQSGRVTNACCAVTGALTLDKTGSAEFALARAVTSTGGLAVDQGIFRLTRAASWPNASFARVSGTGRLVVEADDAFGTNTWIRVSGKGSLELAEGVTLRCAGYNGNGRPAPGGTYAAGTLPGLAGKGILRVAPLQPTVLLVR